MIRRTPSRLLVAAATLLAVAACDEERLATESGDASTLDVLVYVDANGNGTFDAGDEAIVAATVTATGPVTRTADTDGAGMATFTDLVPGAYALSLAANAPTGAVLATATAPVVVAPFQGADLEAQFRFSFEPGTISGRLYRDDDESGSYEPENDLAAAGITVTAEGPDGTEFTTTTAADGSFTIDGLRPGVYEVSFSLPDGAEVTGGPLSVTVTSDTSASLQAVFTGELVIDISEARMKDEGETVTIVGVVSRKESWDDRDGWMQDGTGGIFVRSELSDVSEGDEIRVTGTIDVGFGNEVSVEPTSIEVLSSPGAPDPLFVDGADVNALEHQGVLVELSGVVTSAETVGSFGSQEIMIMTPDGSEVLVYVDNRTGLAIDDWTVGEPVTVTGPVGRFFDAQVEIMNEDDVVMEASTITEARTMVGEIVTLRAVVSRKEGWDDRDGWVQDAGSGVYLSGNLDDAANGDEVWVRGVVEQAFGNQIEIDTHSVLVLDSPGVPDAVDVTGAEVLSEAFQGLLVRVTGEVTDVEVVNSFGTQEVTITTPDASEVIVYVDNRTGLAEGDWTIGEDVTIVAPVGRFFDPQLEVMEGSDVTFGT